jgi:23S rRNA (pseudouridine1915-N3)-methyltransferase
MRTKRSHWDAKPGVGRPRGRSAGRAGLAIRILAGGRWRADDPARALYEDYVRRLPWPVALHEIDPRIGEPARRIAEESARLLAASAEPPGRVLVALDGRGRNLSSEEFAERLRRWQDEGRPAVLFAIGGADGLAASVREEADLVLSFGAMTWPHLMARAMLAEQLYRASAILAGHPYHRA